MSRQPKDRASVWIARIRNSPAVAVVIVFAVVAISISAFITTATGGWKAFREFFHPYDAPRILQFALDPSKSSFYEATGPKFGAGPPIKTFSIDPSLMGVVRTGRAIFQVSMENPNDKDVVVTDVTYHVRELGEVLGGVAGPLESKQTYFHELMFEVGPQKHQLVPPFVIPARSAGAFSLEIYTKDSRPGLAWIMEAEFQSSTGAVSTTSFQLILTGKNGT